MTRISLVLGGAASLGAYTAGAVTEVLLALERNADGEEVAVDVITGSSAGALSAALAARSLAVNPGLVPWIEKTWVEALGADVLLNPDRSDPTSLLDGAALDELTRPLIAGGRAADDRPARAMGAVLRVGIPLTNLHGLSPGPDPCRDEVRVAPRRGARGDAPAWEEMRRAAVAAMAAPGLLSPRQLFRSREGRDPPREVMREGARTPARFADGSVAGDRPLELAERLADQTAGPGQADDRRIIICIDPRASEGGAGGNDGPPAVRPPVDTADVAGLVARATLGRGLERDRRRWEDARFRREILEALADRLPELHRRMDDPEAVALGRRIGELAERVAERLVERRGRPPAGGAADPALDRLEEGLARVRADPAYAGALRAAGSRAGRTRLAKLIFVIEAAAGVERGGSPGLHLVAPGTGASLAGDFMGGFGGFLSPSCRRHDFCRGRQDARRLLEGSLAHVVRYEPDGEEAYETASAPAGYEELPAAARERLESFLRAEAGRVLKELRPEGLGGLFQGLLVPSLRTSAANRALDALRNMP